MPPSACSNPVSDREDDLEDDEDGPEIDDSEILADLPDDTDVRRPAPPPSRSRKRAITHRFPFTCFVRVTRKSTSYIRG